MADDRGDVSAKKAAPRVVLRLVPENPSYEVVEVLKGLCELAKRGELNGIIFGVQMQDAKGQKFYCDSAGTLHRNPVTALGVAGMLHAELEHRMRLGAEDCDL